MNQESEILQLRSGQVMNYEKRKAIIPNSLFMTRLRKGFTLIELLIVIAVLGIVSAGILTAINVAGNLNKANLAKAKTFSASLENDLSINQVGKWSFEETASPFKDTSGYTNSGSCSGSSCPTWKNPTDCGLGFGGCLSFDGVNNYIEVPGNANLNITDKITMQAWVYFKGEGTGNHAVLAKKQGTSLQYGMGRYAVSHRFFAGFAAPNWGDYTSSYVLDDKQWYFLVVTYDRVNVKLYVNGDLKTTIAETDSITGDTNHLLIGADDYGGGPSPIEFTNAYIDEVAIYNQSLTAYQIQNLYAQGMIRTRLAFK